MGAAEFVVALGCVVVLWRRLKAWGWRAIVAVLAAMEALPLVIWAIMFS